MGPGFHEALGRGVALFNRREFWEAHEAWEHGWMNEEGEERLLLQGLIQVAAGLYKLQVGSPRSTVKLLERGLGKLRGFVGASLGVDLEAFIPAVERWQREAAHLAEQQRADYDPGQLPRLSYSPPVVH
jgi:predicted metal-dependent hydrolase